ncbi:hypothetical protein F5148DRAFT_1301896 [Russula earlei]|uniref:Uncharacterized protein n=1 Tax=Russula earlei TaxID=71964 RepID=A0ACC0TQQ4_9AGAM|nr:hypothetical protein F5148DRAFT_1301896 [Russula earlei]
MHPLEPIAHSLNILAEGTTGKKTLLPARGDPYARVLVRLRADHASHSLVPTFYRFSQAQDPESQAAGAQEFSGALAQLAPLLEREMGAKRDPPSGLWLGSGELNRTDVMAGHGCSARASHVMKHYRASELQADPKLRGHYPFKATCSTEKLYLDSYESQGADAINVGRGLL